MPNSISYRLRINSDHSLPVGEELDVEDLVESLEVKIIAYDFKDDTEVETGRALLYLVRLGVAVNNGLNAFNACDSVSQDLYDYASAVLDPETGDVREDVGEEFEYTGGDLLILHLVEIFPAYRGRNLGLVTASRLIDHYGNGLVICRPQPLQFACEDAPELQRRFRERNEKMEYHRFTESKTAAKKKLQTYWSKLGFQPIADGEFFVLSTVDTLPNVMLR